MLCTQCKSKEAIFHYKSSVNGAVYEAHLCSDCAKKYGYSNNTAGIFSNSVFDSFSEGGLFGSLLEGMAGEQPQGNVYVKNVCPFCGMSYAQLKESGKAGCGKCYESFSHSLFPTIRKIHGNVRHVGKIPDTHNEAAKKTKEISDLKEELKLCIEKQEYEKAAELRDRIKAIESGKGDNA